MEGRAAGRERGKPVLVLATLVLVLFGILTGAALTEGLYRAYLYRTARARFVRRVPGSLAVYDRPFWVYDERFGYVYPAGEKVHVTSISDGRVVSCGYWTDFNAEGNIGKIVGDYATAALRVLVFGDSFTATVHDGVTWPLVLQERLTRRLGREAHVVNFARDGYGVLQMFDLAAAKIPEWKPDLVVFSFITNDLERIRFWRTVTKVNGRWRYLVSPRATPDPDPLISYDTALYHPDATAAWCRSRKGRTGADRVLRDVEAVYQRGVSVGERRAANAFTLRHSYVLARLRRGDPFAGVPGMFSFPQVPYDDYADDARFVKSVRAVESTGVPYALVHLAFYPELKAGREYITNYREARLLASLARLTEKEILETRGHIRLPIEDPERLIQSPSNYHPSRAGLELYADAVAEIVIRNRLAR